MNNNVMDIWVFAEQRWDLLYYVNNLSTRKAMRYYSFRCTMSYCGIPNDQR